MTKFLSLFFSFVLFSVSASCVQAEAKRYPIGTAENPVTVQEYCCCLNQNPDALHDGGWFWPEFYYDHDLMNSSGSPMIRSGKRGDYYYSVRVGCDDRIVNDLEGSYAQAAFKKWRELPLIADLCSYINDQIVIKSDYNEKNVLETALEIFLQIKKLAAEDAQKISEDYAGNKEAEHEFFEIDRAVEKQLKSIHPECNIFESIHGSNYDPQDEETETEGREMITLSFKNPLQELQASVVDGLDEYYRGYLFYSWK